MVGTGTRESCTDAVLDVALVGGGGVTFNCGPAPVSIDIGTGTGLKVIAADTSIDGGGMITITHGNGGAFQVPDGVTLNLRGVAVSARAPAISNRGTLNVTDSTFSDSTWRGGIPNCTFFGLVGGAISNCGTASVTNSTFSDNRGYEGGGAIFNGGTLVVSGSTFVGNQSICILCGGFGGAIDNADMLSVSNSTFVDNGAGLGGAIHNRDMLTVTNSTFVGNSIANASTCGSDGDGPCPAMLRNTIVVGSSRGDNCVGPITDGGHNIDDGTSCGFSAASGSLSNTSPKLDPAGLQDNGGLTQTVAVCTGVGTPTGCPAASPVIDAGDESVCAAAPVNGADQRGYVRPGAGHTQCSIGAFETDAIPGAACVGDCNGDGTVVVNELILGVDIVLGVQPVWACPAFTDSSGLVNVAQIVKGVNNALGGVGCAAPLPTATAKGSATATASPSETATVIDTVTATPSSSGTPTNMPTATNTRHPATDLYVSSAAAGNGDGQLANPYRRITDAVAHARDERTGGLIEPAQAIRVHVAPGTYVGSFDAAALRDHPDYEVLPIILNVPNLMLRGGTVLLRDGRNLPTATQPGTDTILQPDTHLRANQYLLIVTRTANGAGGDDVTIDGFALDGLAGEFPGADVFLDRVAGFRFSNNLVERSAFGVMTRLASGLIEGNLLANNLELGSVVTGGSATYPANVVIHGNRATANGAHGLGYVSAGWIGLRSDPGLNTVQLLEPLQTVFDRNLPQDLDNIPDTLTVTLMDNDASNNGIGNTFGGIGIRFGNIWPDFDYHTTDSSQPLTSVLHATLIDNTAAGNGAYGVDIEAGDPRRLETRQFHQSVEASFQGNVFTDNGRANGLFTFTYWLASIDSSQLYVQKYAEQSTYALTANDSELVPFDYDNPLTDPIVGTTLNDTLTLNGVAVPRGQSITPLH